MLSNTALSGVWTTDFADRIQPLLDGRSMTAPQFRRRAEKWLTGLRSPVSYVEALAAKAVLLSVALRFVGVDDDALIEAMFGRSATSLTQPPRDRLRRRTVGSGQSHSARGCAVRIAEKPGRDHTSTTGNASAFSTTDWNRAAARLYLSRRELEIVMRLFDGESEKQVASDLRITTRTVHTHVEHIYLKTHAQNRAQLLVRVFWALTRDPGVSVCDFCGPDGAPPDR